MAHISPTTNQRLSHGEMWQVSVPEVAPPGSIRTVSGKHHKEVVMPLFVTYEFGPCSVFRPVTFDSSQHWNYF